jgi:hypothetical protein
MDRTDVPYAADERAMLIAWLDWHRATVSVKTEGLAEDLATGRCSPHPRL